MAHIQRATYALIARSISTVGSKGARTNDPDRSMRAATVDLFTRNHLLRKNPPPSITACVIQRLASRAPKPLKTDGDVDASGASIPPAPSDGPRVPLDLNRARDVVQSNASILHPTATRSSSPMHPVTVANRRARHRRPSSSHCVTSPCLEPAQPYPYLEDPYATHVPVTSTRAIKAQPHCRAQFISGL